MLPIKIKIPDIYLGEMSEFTRISNKYNRTTTGNVSYTNPDTSTTTSTTGTIYDNQGEQGLGLLLYNVSPKLSDYIFDDITYQILRSSVSQSLTPIQPTSGTALAIIVSIPTDYDKFILEIPTTITGGNITINGLPLYVDYALTEQATELEAGLYEIYDRNGTAFFQPPKSGGNLAWVQQYDGFNPVLKTDKDKDVTVKVGEYVYNEFYPTKVGDVSTASLLHMDGADGSTTFTDDAVNAPVWTANGNAQIDTAQSKFGGASALFDGTGDWIDTPANDAFNLGSNDFTIDFWVKKADDGIRRYLCGQSDASITGSTISFAIRLEPDNTVDAFVYDGASNVTLNSVGTILTTDGMVHIALIRDGNDLKLFIGGVQEATGDVTGYKINNSSNNLSIGRLGEFTSSTFNGHIDEFRFVNGEALYTSNFTPPVAPYDNPVGQIFPPTTQATVATDLQATVAGALEMYNPEVGQVYQGFTSKFNEWLPSMEGAYPPLGLEEFKNPLNFGGNLVDNTATTSQLIVNGRGWLICLSSSNISSVKLKIDGTYFIGSATSSLDISQESVYLMARFESSFEIESEDSLSIINGFYMLGDDLKDTILNRFGAATTGSNLQTSVTGEGWIISAFSTSGSSVGCRLDIDSDTSVSFNITSYNSPQFMKYFKNGFDFYTDSGNDAGLTYILI